MIGFINYLQATLSLLCLLYFSVVFRYRGGYPVLFPPQTWMRKGYYLEILLLASPLSSGNIQRSVLSQTVWSIRYFLQPR